MKTTKAQRDYARFPVRWPVTYWNQGLFGQGTVLEVSHELCRVAGTISVAAGMVLQLWISPPQKEAPLCVEEARVLWVKDHEFWIELRRLPAIDRCELMGFLETCSKEN
jgi:hypothetical protein